MGASSSTEQISPEQKEIESLASSTGALPVLQKAFSKLADPQTNSIPIKSLQECFHLNFSNDLSEISSTPDRFPRLLSCLGPTIADTFFIADKGGVNWIEFLRGYVRCCGRMSLSLSINNFYRLYAATSEKAGIPSKLQFESEDADCKVSGSFMSTDSIMFLLTCWIMSESSRIWKFSQSQAKLQIPDIDHLMLSALASCSESVKDLNIWDFNVSTSEVELPAQKFHMWILSTVPNLANCFTQYVHTRLQIHATVEDNSEPSSSPTYEFSVAESHNRNLVTCGRAWAISLTLRSTLRDMLLSTCMPRDGDDATYDNLLYCSSIHGKGMNRFWSNVEGYNGPMLILISASSGDTGSSDSNGKWIIGILTEQGFENKDTFYGSSGYLYAISPMFEFFSPHGKEKNFLYSHLHLSAKAYDPHPKPVGMAFGGTLGNERIFIDEDFAKITVRHHAVDKTYKPGPLVPNQGFLPLEASIFTIEVWGLGGEKAKTVQNAHKEREQLFTEQRRQVDLKNFSWEDSPEKAMMDMVSDPNKVRREDR